MNEVKKENTTTLKPAIIEGKAIYMLTTNKLTLCETPREFIEAIQNQEEYNPLIIIKGDRETLCAEMARHDLINSIRAMTQQEIYDGLCAQDRVIKTVNLMPPSTPDWTNGISIPVTTDFAEDTNNLDDIETSSVNVGSND